MDVMFVTQGPDELRRYTGNTPQNQWKQADFAQSYLDFAASQQQALRVNAIAPGRAARESIVAAILRDSPRTKAAR